MLSPLWVSHSRQAATHERHPIQREVSRNICLTTTVSATVFLFLSLVTRQETPSAKWEFSLSAAHDGASAPRRAPSHRSAWPTPVAQPRGQPRLRRPYTPGSSSSAPAPDWSGYSPLECARSAMG